LMRCVSAPTITQSARYAPAGSGFADVRMIDLPSAAIVLVTPVIFMGASCAIPGIPVMVRVAFDILGISRSLKVSLIVLVRATVALAAGVAATSLGWAKAAAGVINVPRAAMIAAVVLNFISISCGCICRYASAGSIPHASWM